MAVMELKVALTVLMILYGLALFFGFLASVPMVLHVYPQSECLLFSAQYGDSLSYGHYASKYSTEIRNRLPISMKFSNNYDFGKGVRVKGNVWGWQGFNKCQKIL